MKRDTDIQFIDFFLFIKNSKMFHMKKSDKDELLSCDRYVNKPSQSVFYTKEVYSLLVIYVETVHM